MNAGILSLHRTVGMSCVAKIAVANGRASRVLAQPVFAPEETTPKELTLATVLLFAKGTKFIAFWFLLSFLRSNEGDRQYTINETILVKVINEQFVTS